MGIGAFDIGTMVTALDKLINHMCKLGMTPGNEKVFTRRFSYSEAAEMVGRSLSTIKRLCEKHGIEQLKPDEISRSRGLSLEQINELRKHAGTMPTRSANERAIIIAVQSYKGGTGKTTTSVLLSQYLALLGFRVALWDCDPQASATCSFGFIPDQSFREEDTIIPFLNGQHDTFHYAVKKTYFPGLDLIPSCMHLNVAGVMLYTGLAHAAESDRSDYHHEFQRAIRTIQNDYDVIILDSPPTLDMISINIVGAADGVVVPCPIAMTDITSTREYLAMMQLVLKKTFPEKEFEFVKLLVTKLQKNQKSKQMNLLELMTHTVGKWMYLHPLRHEPAIQNASTFFKTLYEITGSDASSDKALRVSKETYWQMKECFDQVAAELTKIWGRDNLIPGGANNDE